MCKNMKITILKLFLYACILSTVVSARHKKKKYTYNDVYVTFPDDPCDDAKVEMPDFSARNRPKSQVKCFEYVWRVRYEQGKVLRMTQCEKTEGDRTPVLGGSDTFEGEYAHMGALGWKARVGTWIFRCGSSLISEKFALTAAHCSKVPSTDQTVTDPEPKIVRLGCKNIMDVDKGEPAYDVNIRRFISHHRYQSPMQYYDIALVELEQEVAFRWYVHPACLWTDLESPGEAYVTGWGVIDSASLKTSPELQKAEIPLIKYDECNQMLELKQNERTWWGVAGHQLCAGDSAGRIDTCSGDSGGPLQTLVPLRYSSSVFRWKLHQIVGVTSFGFGCARSNTPAIYTKVAAFVSWIEQIVWPSNRTLAKRKWWRGI